MLSARQWAVAGAKRPLVRTWTIVKLDHCSRASMHKSNLSAIIKGLRREDGASRSASRHPDKRRVRSFEGRKNANRYRPKHRDFDAKPRNEITIFDPADDFQSDRRMPYRTLWNNGQERGRNPRNGLTSRAMEGAGSERQRQKLQKKLSRKADEDAEEVDDGKQTRRKRFLDPGSAFGKNSLVYRIKHGDLKGQVPVREPERPRSEPQGFSSTRDPFFNRPGDRSQRVNPDRSRFADRRRDRSREQIPMHGRFVDQLQPKVEEDAAPPREPKPLRDRSKEPRYARGLLPGQWIPREKDRLWAADKAGSKPTTSPIHRSWERLISKEEKEAIDTMSDAWWQGFDKPVKPDLRYQFPATGSSLDQWSEAMIRFHASNSTFLYGREPVTQALRSGRRRMHRLYIYGGPNRRATPEDENLIKLAEGLGIPVEIVPLQGMSMMSKMAGGRPHNGLVLEAAPLPQRPVVSLGKVTRSVEKSGFYLNLGYQSREERLVNSTDKFVSLKEFIHPQPLVILLNAIVDPGNVGGLIRSAGFLGAAAVAITQHNTAPITGVVLKASAGAAELMDILAVSTPQKFLEESRENGWETYAAVGPPSERLKNLHPKKFITLDDIEARKPLNTKPCILVLGNEGMGLPKHLKTAVDYEVTVPRLAESIGLDSLNVSVAGGILMNSFLRPPSGKGVAVTNDTGKQGQGRDAPAAEPSTEEEGEKLF